MKGFFQPGFPCIKSYDKLRWVCSLYGMGGKVIAGLYCSFFSELVVDKQESKPGRWQITLKAFPAMMRKLQRMLQTSTWSEVRKATEALCNKIQKIWQKKKFDPNAALSVYFTIVQRKRRNCSLLDHQRDQNSLFRQPVVQLAAN